MTRTAIPNTDLNQYPTADLISTPAADKQITLGDLHGNPIKLIYFLVREGVLQLNPTVTGAGAGAAAETAESLYQALLDIYAIADNPEELVTQLARFEAILNAATINDIGRVRLIGDVLADRGQQDYLTLMLMAKLREKGLPLEVDLSNHDLIFLDSYNPSSTDAPFGTDSQTDELAEQLDATPAESKFRSLYQLRALLSAQPDLLTSAQTYTESYLQSLKLISCTLSTDGKSLSVYTHAPINLVILDNIAKRFGLVFDRSSAINMAKSIDAINQEFAKLSLEQKKALLAGAYAPPSIVRESGDFVRITQPASGWNSPGHLSNTEAWANEKHLDPFYALCWNQNTVMLSHDRANFPEKLTNGDTLAFIHGHISSISTPAINLDTRLGQRETKSKFSDTIISLHAQDGYRIHNARGTSPVAEAQWIARNKQKAIPSWWASRKPAAASLIAGGVIAAGLIAVGSLTALGILTLPITFMAIGPLSAIMVSGIIIAALGLLVGSAIAAAVAIVYENDHSANRAVIFTDPKPLNNEGVGSRALPTAQAVASPNPGGDPATDAPATDAPAATDAESATAPSNKTN